VASELYVFRWHVPAGGYQWVSGHVAGGGAVAADGSVITPGQGQERPARFLIRNLTVAEGERREYDQREYEPLQDYPALFRTFADTRLTEEGVLEFANQFGELGIWCKVVAGAPDWNADDGPPPKREFTGTPLAWWSWHITRMWQAVELWDAIPAGGRKGDPEALGRLVRWEKGPRGPYVLYTGAAGTPRGVGPPPGETVVGPVIASPRLNPEWLAVTGFHEKDVCVPAAVYLNRLINARLRGKGSPMLLRDLQSGATCLRHRPDSLLSCLWHQLAQTVEAAKEQWQCYVCKKWFEPRRRDDAEGARHFCGDACRSRAYRGRQREALRMHAEGKAAGQIAKELGATPEAARGWVQCRDARQLRAEGKGVKQIAEELGVGVAKVKRWLKGTKGD
jgi:DNA-binding CsgD family transcriptional regulator